MSIKEAYLDKKESAHTRPLTAQIYTVQGERVGWIDQEGYIHAFLPAAWITSYGDLIGYVDPHGMVRMWGQWSPKEAAYSERVSK